MKTILRTNASPSHIMAFPCSALVSLVLVFILGGLPVPASATDAWKPSTAMTGTFIPALERKNEPESLRIEPDGRVTYSWECNVATGRLSPDPEGVPNRFRAVFSSTTLDTLRVAVFDFDKAARAWTFVSEGPSADELRSVAPYALKDLGNGVVQRNDSWFRSRFVADSPLAPASAEDARNRLIGHWTSFGPAGNYANGLLTPRGYATFDRIGHGGQGRWRVFETNGTWFVAIHFDTVLEAQTWLLLEADFRREALQPRAWADTFEEAMAGKSGDASAKLLVGIPPMYRYIPVVDEAFDIGIANSIALINNTTPPDFVLRWRDSMVSPQD